MRRRIWRAAVVAALLTGIAPVAAAEAAAPHRPRPLPLERLFDNRAVSDDARPGAADFDGAGASLSARALATAGWTPGRSLGVDGAELTLPRSSPGERDNVVADGQTVRVRGRGDALAFLVAGTGGEAGDTGTVRYRDGSRGSYRLTAPDWRTGPLATKAVA
ncbi:SGNH/GDSL hydrolase family protein, partial [Streptomyces alfalfae]